MAGELDGMYGNPGKDETVFMLDITKIRRNPYQPRTEFDAESLRELADSISEHGVIQPIIVRKSIKGYDIVAGERRFRASRLAGKETIPAIVKELADRQMMEFAIIENLQRENLNPLEEAGSYHELMNELGITQNALAERLGKSRPYIANMLRLLNLPPRVRRMISAGELSGAHGRTLLPLKDPLLLEAAAKKAADEKLSVRALEAYVKSLSAPSVKRRKKVQDKPAFINRYETKLKERFGTNVEISRQQKKGTISLEFKDEEEFKRIISILENS
ncbi:MAG TPA: ParB/RepB/Spo0J family partition protein [Candidatus Salinicoccus stercoripullorum]|uniref:ParB/RepB/Spo0J family partition protein n=1 Tax=Candidatus Salinicoccus stercoripullorum TaxID=2838756 RepID=A0A9D1QHJ2_9STAP|nr:ParB/RepB/Spo0J family partition protein [Candidatus Salinicoccus stercoripullorum]